MSSHLFVIFVILRRSFCAALQVIFIVLFVVLLACR